MATIGLDTHKAVKALTEVGFSEQQAETVVSTVREALGGDLATKTDLQILKSDLEAKMRESELRMVMKVGTIMIAVGGLIVALIKILP